MILYEVSDENIETGMTSKVYEHEDRGCALQFLDNARQTVVGHTFTLWKNVYTREDV